MIYFQVWALARPSDVFIFISPAVIIFTGILQLTFIVCPLLAACVIVRLDGDIFGGYLDLYTFPVDCFQCFVIITVAQWGMIDLITVLRVRLKIDISGFIDKFVISGLGFRVLTHDWQLEALIMFIEWLRHYKFINQFKFMGTPTCTCMVNALPWNLICSN